MTSDREHEELLKLLPAKALNSLDADEAGLLDQHLPGCDICQDELASYAAVVDLLPLAAPEALAPPALRGRLISEIKAEQASEPAAVSTPEAVPGPSGSWWLQFRGGLQNLLAGPRWRPAAVLVIVILLASNVIVWQATNNTGGGGDSWRRVRLAGTGAAPEAVGIIYISADGRNGTIIVDKLPQLGLDQQYQLWLIEDSKRTSGGVFSVDDDGYRGVQIQSPRPLQEYGAFGVTIEPAGGSPGPTGERVLGSDL